MHDDISFAMTDLSGRILTVDQSYALLLGYTPEEMQKLRLHDITHEDDLGNNLAMIDRLMKGGESFVIRKRYYHKNASIFWVENRVTLLKGKSRPTGFGAVSRRIPEPRNLVQGATPEQSAAAWNCADYIHDMAQSLGMMADACGLQDLSDLLQRTKEQAHSECVRLSMGQKSSSHH